MIRYDLVNGEGLTVDAAVQHPAKVSHVRDRRLALVCLASLAAMFSIVTYLLEVTAQRSSETAANKPPRFTTELSSNSKGEWLLLPGVGPRTAERWEKTLESMDNWPTVPELENQDIDSKVVAASFIEAQPTQELQQSSDVQFSSLSRVPIQVAREKKKVSINSLEDLPGIGVKRAEQLSPMIPHIPAHPVK